MCPGGKITKGDRGYAYVSPPNVAAANICSVDAAIPQSTFLMKKNK